MSIAHPSAPSARLRRRETASRASARPIWFQAGSVWVAHIDYSVVGVIERHGLAFRASNDLGDPVGVFLTLRAAKASLDSAGRGSRRDEVYGGNSQRDARISGAIALGLVFFGGIAGTLLIQAPL